MSKENLFDGIQIMTAEEMNNSVTTGEGTESNSEEQKKEFEFQIPGQTTEEVVIPTSETTTVVPEKVEISESKQEAIYKALTKQMVEEGVLTIEELEKLEELPGSLDTIKSLIQQTVEKGLKEKEEDWKNSLSPAKKRYFEIEDAFDSEQAAITAAQRIEFFDKITDDTLSENVELQKQIYFELLKSKGFSDADATEKVEDADALGKLDTEASKALPQLKKLDEDFIENARTEKLKAAKATEEKNKTDFDNLLKTIESKESFIDGINLNKVAKDKLKDNILKPVHTDEKGRQYTSLAYKQKVGGADFNILMSYYDSIGLFDMDKSGKFKPDISKLKTVAKTKAVSELDKIIARDEEKGVGRNTSVETSDLQKNILDVLEKGFKK